MAKHFDLIIGDASFAFHRKQAEIAAEAALDGIYVIRTSLAEAAIGAADVVSAYKSLSQSLSPCRRGWSGPSAP